jgi:hypothetical protein
MLTTEDHIGLVDVFRDSVGEYPERKWSVEDYARLMVTFGTDSEGDCTKETTSSRRFLNE